MKLVVSQPRYLPVINYLQRIHAADVFVLLDDVQRQRRGFENRNKILLNGCTSWITVPIASSSREKIFSTQVDGLDWVDMHANKIINAYKKHLFFNLSIVDACYTGMTTSGVFFVDIIERHLLNICKLFSLDVHFLRSSSLNVNHETTGAQHIFDIAKALGATTYISGVNGISYGVDNVFGDNISVLYNVYVPQSYPQPNQDNFIPWLCFFDTLFSIGLERTRDLITAPLSLALKEEALHAHEDE